MGHGARRQLLAAIVFLLVPPTLPVARAAEKDCALERLRALAGAELHPDPDARSILIRLRDGDREGAAAELYSLVELRARDFYRIHRPEEQDDLVHGLFLAVWEAVESRQIIEPAPLEGAIRVGRPEQLKGKIRHAAKSDNFGFAAPPVGAAEAVPLDLERLHEDTFRRLAARKPPPAEAPPPIDPVVGPGPAAISEALPDVPETFELRPGRTAYHFHLPIVAARRTADRINQFIAETGRWPSAARSPEEKNLAARLRFYRDSDELRNHLSPEARALWDAQSADRAAAHAINAHVERTGALPERGSALRRRLQRHKASEEFLGSLSPGARRLLAAAVPSAEKARELWTPEATARDVSQFVLREKRLPRANGRERSLRDRLQKFREDPAFDRSLRTEARQLLEKGDARAAAQAARAELSPSSRTAFELNEFIARNKRLPAKGKAGEASLYNRMCRFSKDPEWEKLTTPLTREFLSRRGRATRPAAPQSD